MNFFPRNKRRSPSSLRHLWLHLCRIRDSMKLLCQQLQKHSHYQAILTPANQLLIYHAALLHDIGKMRVPLDLNIKSGALSSEEFEIMAQHAVWGKVQPVAEIRATIPDEYLTDFERGLSL